MCLTRVHSKREVEALESLRRSLEDGCALPSSVLLFCFSPSHNYSLGLGLPFAREQIKHRTRPVRLQPMESGAVPTPAEEDGFCDLDDDDDSSAVEDDAGELEDRYYVGEEELLDYIVRRNEQETAAAAAREDLVGREQREEEAEEEPEGAGTDSAPWAGLDHDVPSSSASGLAANLVREDRTHYQVRHSRRVTCLADH